MDRASISSILSEVANGALSVQAAAERLRTLPFDDLAEIARVDHHRELRSGIPEIIYGESKTASEIKALLLSLSASGAGALATRVAPVKAAKVITDVASAVYHERGQILMVAPTVTRQRGRGSVAVVCAGTSDLPVADEAALTLEFLGHPVVRFQ